jgi:hypothetical protein
MSEPLGFQQRKRQVDEQANGYEQTDGVVDQHVLTSLESIAAGDIADADDEEHDGDQNEQQVEHCTEPPAVLTSVSVAETEEKRRPC